MVTIEYKDPYIYVMGEIYCCVLTMEYKDIYYYVMEEI